MPTYEYRCKDCGEHLEIVQSFRDDPLTECPACRGTLKKVFQPVGIAFKGTGFYRNDARSGSSSSSSASSGSSASTSSDGGSSSTSSTDGGSSTPSTSSSSSSSDKGSSDKGSSSTSTSTEAKSA
jgi:putative FmdB family regulatory protein